ncbi:hypothetical protein Agub_g5801, partial [Astrephomene gubernaculifera]
MNVAVLMNLARALREVGRQQRAAEVYGAVTRLQPDHPSAHYRRGAILRSLRRNEEALAAFRQHLRLHPEHQASRFWVAAITGDVGGMAAAPADMVAGLFDQYADHFDDHLVNKLQYRTPEALRDQLLASYDRITVQPDTSNNSSSGGAVTTAAAADDTERSSSNAAASTCHGPHNKSSKKDNNSSIGGSSSKRVPSWRRCVDLGCGTGLMGPLLQPYCKIMEGVDLSAGMVDQASKRGCYSRLAVAELVAFLEQQKEEITTAAAAATALAATVVPYDLFVAADVFVYIGDLQPVMRAAAAVAAPGAILAFSTEALERAPSGKANRGLTPSAAAAATETGSDGAAAAAAAVAASEGDASSSSSSSATAGLRLQVTGRYAHSEEYLRRTGAGCGWELVSVSQSVIRYNGGE